MSLLNSTVLQNLLVDNLYIQNQFINTNGANIMGVNTPALSTEVIINDFTKNQVLFEEIYGNIHGNTFPQLQAEIDAIEANVLLLQAQDVNLQNQINATNSNVVILQGNVVSLQSQINVLSGNVVIDEQAIAELIADTQFLEAPYAGLVGNTSYFVNGLQMWSGANENGNGMFVYKDGGTAGLSQIRMKVEDDKNILIEGGATQQLKPKSTGTVLVKSSDGNFNFTVGDRNLPNFQFVSNVEMNGSIALKGQDNNYIQVYTQPSSLVPPSPAVKRVDIRGDNELRLNSAYVRINEDGGGFLQGQSGQMLLQGGSGGYFTVDKNPRIQTVGGSSPGTINIQVGECDLNTTGRINIGTEQGLTELGYKEIYVGQAGPPTAARKSSTLIDGDIYLPQNLLPPPAGSPNLGGWDNICYLGLPTAYSGPFRGPLKNTYTPYVKSISTFFSGPTINSFISLAGTFTVAVGLGAINMTAGAGGVVITSGIGAIALTTAGGAIALTTGGGACQITTGAGIINMTTGAGLIQMETNSGDVIIQPGNAPGGVGGSAYLKPKDYLILNPDNQVIFGEDGNLPVYGSLIDTSDYQFNGNLFLTGNVINSNVFQTQAIDTYLTGASFGYISWINPNLVANTYGNATMDIVNYDNNTVIVSSGVSPINPDTYGTFSFGSGEVLLPSNANIVAKIYPQGNIVNYGYKTWQSNANIAGNVGVIINAVLRPNNVNTTHYVNVFGNVFFNEELDTYGNIVLKNIVNNDTTIITDDSIFTTGDITAQNFYGNSHQVSGNITGDYFIGNNMILSQTGQAQFLRATNSVILDPQVAPITNPANALSNSGGQLYFNGNVIAGGAGGVTQIIAGNGIEISPLIGTGNVIVSLAGSVIPPGGYLPIAGGTMTGSIYQSPATATSGTIKKYRPLTSYQPPFPSISTPSFTGEQLTFFNGDNSPEQINFTGWFPQFMFNYQPSVITNAIPGVASNFYSSTGGTLNNFTDFPSILGNFTVGQRITGGNMVVYGSNPGYRGVLFYIYTAPPNTGDRTQWTLLYQTTLKNFPTSPTITNYSLSDIDYTYDGSIPQLGQNWMVVYTDYNTQQEYIGLNTVNGQVGGLVNYYQWDGYIANYVNPDEYFIGVQGDALTSVLYEYFPATNTVNKILAVSGGTPTALINGIYIDDVAVSRQIIVYGNFTTLTNTSGSITVNHIFQYNIDTGAITRLETSTADPAYSGQNPIGFNNQVWGVEKQLSTVFSRRVWIWGEFNTVNQMGNPNPPNDIALIASSIGCTLSDNWAITQTWLNMNQNTKLQGCYGGRIVIDDPNDFSKFALMVFALTRNSIALRSITIVYYNVGVQDNTGYPFGNGNFGNPAITTNIVTRIDKIAYRDLDNLVQYQAVFCGSYIGQAEGVGLVDVTCYSLCSTQITGVTWNPAFNPPWSYVLRVLARSGDASFWYPNNKLIGSTTYYVQENGTNTEKAIIGTTGYASTTTNGGGVLTMNNIDFLLTTPTVNKFFIEGVQAYSVNDIIFKDTTKVELTCSLNEDNFWFGQTFDFTISPSPTPPTVPTVNTINGAKFLVNNTEMDKIVFSGGDTDFASVSFIAGSVENGDPHWYWQSQVGALDYYAGNTLYANITASGSVGGSGVYTAGENITINGNVISVSNPLTSNLNISSLSINGNSLGQLNMTLDSTGLYQIDNFTDSSNLTNTQLLFIDNTNLSLAQLTGQGLGLEDSTGNVIASLNNTQMVLSNITSNQYISIFNDAVSNPQITLEDSGSIFSINKASIDTNISQTTGNINFSTPDILSITSQNAVEIGTPQRRQLIVSFEKQNTGTLTGQNNFDSITGIQNVSAWSNPTNDIYINSITVAFGYDDGMSGNSTITVALIQDDSGTETVLGSENYTTGSGLSSTTVIFNPPITINPSATKTFFVRMSVPPASPMYSYFGTVDGVTPYCVVLASQLESVSDPIEYFNVYGNSFFQDNMLIHANLVVADPTNQFFYTQIEHNYIQFQGETFNTQIGPGSTYITSGVNQQVQQATFLQVKRTDITRQATLNNGSLAFIEGTNRTATYSPFTCDINSTSGPIARATLQVGTLALNNNSAGGSTITLNKDAISVATDEISSISSSTKDANGTSRVFTRLQSRTSAVGTGNQDGTIAIFTLVNGVLLEVFNFHGGENENNSFRNLDMNGNSVRTTQGNISLTATASSGVGNATIQSKAGALINMDTGITGQINFNTSTTQTSSAHNVQFNSNSSGVSGQNYLKCQLNGTNIWIPYLLTDPSI